MTQPGTPQRHTAAEYADQQPRLPCNRCGGEAVHVRTTTTNGWINAASAYDSYDYECPECGATGGSSEQGDRTGCVAPPAPPEPPEVGR